MKSILLIAVLTMSTLFATAQQVSYKILEDDPKQAYTKYLAPAFGMEYNSTAISAYLGGTGRYGITDKIVLEGNAWLDLWLSNGKGPGFMFEAGGFLPLFSKTKRKDVPIILSYNPNAGTRYENGKTYNVEETKFIKVDGDYLNKIGVRGGLHNRRTGSTNLEETVNASIFLSGVYLGGQFTSQAYVRSLINNDVERYGAGFTRIYGDILVLPVSNISDPAADQDVKSDGVIGWRVGFQWYVSPHSGDFRFLGPSVFSAEIGSRPLSGFMFNITYGIALASKK